MEDITPQTISEMVHRFYGRVREDDVIGPVFARRIENWTPHLERMVDFWRTILLGEALFRISPRGGPPVLHKQIEELEYAHFDRWLQLFGEVAAEVFSPEAASIVVSRATQIGAALSAHLEPWGRPQES